MIFKIDGTVDNFPFGLSDGTSEGLYDGTLEETSLGLKDWKMLGSMLKNEVGAFERLTVGVTDCNFDGPLDEPADGCWLERNPGDKVRVGEPLDGGAVTTGIVGCDENVELGLSVSALSFADGTRLSEVFDNNPL